MVTTSEFFATLPRLNTSELFEAFCGLKEQILKADLNGLPFIIIRNPTKIQLKNLIETDDFVKGLIASDNSLYVWKAFYKSHDQMIEYLKSEFGIEDTYNYHLYLGSNIINTSKFKKPNSDEQLKLFDNIMLQRLYGKDLDISFPDLD